jgi:hypothetical protein
MPKHQAAIEKIRELVVIQSRNANFDQYMRGMANGLICALSVLEEKEPVYINAPKDCPRMVLTKNQMSVLGIYPPDCIEAQPLPEGTKQSELEPT